jgi:streptogramin lyase
MIETNTNKLWLATGLVATLGLIMGNFVSQVNIATAVPTYSTVSKISHPGISSSSYATAQILPTSDGSVWFSGTDGEGFGIINYNPETNSFSPAYYWSHASPTRYRYMVGPDDNLYQSMAGGFYGFDTETKSYKPLQAATPEGYSDCYGPYYNDAIIRGDELVMPTACFDDSDMFYGMLYSNILNDKSTFVVDKTVEDFISVSGTASDNAGRVVIVNNYQYNVYDTDCETGQTVLLYSGESTMYNYGLSPLGTPALALDQKANLYFPTKYYDEETYEEKYVMVKVNTATGEETLIDIPVDSDSFSGYPTMVRGDDDNIYFATGEGIFQVDTNANQITNIAPEIHAMYSGNTSIARGVDGQIWTTYCDDDSYCGYFNPDEYEDGEELPADSGIAVFKVDQTAPERHPLTCPVADKEADSDEDSDSDEKPDSDKPSSSPVVPAAPNTGVRIYNDFFLP